MSHISDAAIAEFAAVVTQIPGWSMGETVFRMAEVAGLKHITMAQLADWYWAASPGDVLVYAEGDLAYARYRLNQAGRFPVPGCPVDMDAGSELQTLANTAYDYSNLKRACLTQKRMDGGGFQYLATKRDDKARAKLVPDSTVANHREEPAAIIPVVLDHTEPVAAGNYFGYAPEDGAPVNISDTLPQVSPASFDALDKLVSDVPEVEND